MKNASRSNAPCNSYTIDPLYTLSRRCLLLLSFCFCSLVLHAQVDEHGEEPFKPHHAISLLLSHTHTAQGIEDGKKKWLTLPSWALDYNYFFSKQWAVGLHNDMIVETFKIEEHETNNEAVERTRPIATVAVVNFKPGKHFLFQMGAGGEFAKEGNYFLNRIGLEYALELQHAWELASNLTWDLKWNAYNSFSFGVGVSKAFGFRKK